MASLGGALEFYDFVLFVFFTSYIGEAFFPTGMAAWLKQTEVWGLFSAGYLARPVGGVIMAHVGDRAGRKRTFVLSVVMMAAATFAIGLLPGYRVLGVAAPLLLLACRLVQGAAVGGEVPAAWVFVAEHAGARRTGLACGLLTAGLTGGILLGSLVNLTMAATLSPASIASFGWRSAFLLGGVLGLGGALLRRRLSETPVFEALQREATAARRAPAVEVLRHSKAAVAASMLATWLLTAAIVVLILMGPTLLQHLHGLTRDQTAPANLAGTAALALGCVLAGTAIDRFGLRPVALAGGVALAASGYLLFGPGTPAPLTPVYALAGLMTGAVSVVPVFMVRVFSAAVAVSGVSLSYNLAYAVAGGLTPPVVVALAHRQPTFPAWYVALVAAIGVTAITAYRLPAPACP